MGQIEDYGLARSKWDQFAAMRKDPLLKGMLIPTKKYTFKGFKKGLKRFPIIFLKPEIGGKGNGIIKVARLSSGYLIQGGTTRRFVKKRKKAALYIHQELNNKPYIWQKGIELLTVNGRPVDFRVLLLKPDNQWKTVGIMGKWAKRNKIVTNYSQGGQAISVQDALIGLPSSHKSVAQIEREMSKWGIHLAKKYFNYSRMFGLDLALDKKGKLWILEGNTKPGYKLFRYHKDKQLYPLIQRHVKQILKNRKWLRRKR
ncbi:YheC/YheD family protein [Ammoniphilus sp. CFH 90114]|uniref:YheC/YheD family protein n=1 Tax=Ammoniphilus sp. CFH 90114 TaxID=2493665 RepID=UPI00100DA606|nr:YheC/YheD family protein [Ammoniphilus sp. CFH 90114]RXT07195.1 hypothetical protein EIZ39_13710 [Ammoniphilus sp. CFH 90114]